MGFLLAVLSCVVAEEVVGLEPVNASSTNVYKCNALNSGSCNNDPYCYWLSGPGKCIDDPCLKYRALASDTCPPNVGSIDGGEVVSCEPITLTNFGNHDCSGNPGSGALCAQNVGKTSLFTYCEYTQLKDGSCPDSICMTSNNADKHCVRNSPGGDATHPCRGLTETDCKLIPKCYWDSGACTPDVCFQVRVTTQTCHGVIGNTNWPGTVIAEGTCVDWHPLSNADGSALDYCVHKNNAKANICYFGNKNITTDGSSGSPKDFPYDWSADWNSGSDPGTYPTYNYGDTNPLCGTDALPQCEGHGQCKTIVNQKGAFAGKYCTDGTHAAANILRIPSLLVFLVVFLGSLFSL